MTADLETFADLVAAAAGTGRPLTYEQLAKRSVDPETGYRPSANLVWRISSGADIKVNAQLVRAMAAGLELPLVRVQAAAAYQFTGFVSSELGGGVAVHDPGVDVETAPKSRAVLEGWDDEESGSRGNHSAGR
ncbi:hypothetical protein ABZW02_25760 [Streptomyces sp. NPDC005180]|uniref:hypothetical protein n=1 Tax=Streptomyces sp. NPDC005180 TaxID=3156868 RepID=UPI0033AA1132